MVAGGADEPGSLTTSLRLGIGEQFYRTANRCLVDTMTARQIAWGLSGVVEAYRLQHGYAGIRSSPAVLDWNAAQGA